MLMGDKVKTVNHTIQFWWESSGHARDRALGNAVAVWIGKSGKALDKKPTPDVLKELVDQFPYIVACQCDHAQLQSARWEK